MTAKERKCKCNVRGVVRLYTIKDYIGYAVHPDDEARYLRKFKFCPLCGRRILK